MNIGESGQMYLETILILSKEKTVIRAIDVGEYMSFSKPSVSRALGILRNDGMLTIAENGGITLTEAGRTVAEAIYERHTILSGLLLRLGVSEDTAAKDACKMEHAISDESFRAIKKYYHEHL